MNHSFEELKKGRKWDWNIYKKKCQKHKSLLKAKMLEAKFSCIWYIYFPLMFLFVSYLLSVWFNHLFIVCSKNLFPWQGHWRQRESCILLGTYALCNFYSFHKYLLSSFLVTQKQIYSCVIWLYKKIMAIFELLCFL